MQPPLYVRPLTDAERGSLEAGLRSADAFVLRRCQAVLASARGEPVPRIAAVLGCDQQTVRNAIHAFERDGAAGCLVRRSKRPHRIRAKLDAAGAERLRALVLQRSPRGFGKDTGVWTLDLAADVAVEQGITAERVSDETVRMALERLGVAWKRAKHRISSPDPQYARKKGRATA
jgi:transposase